MAMGILPHPQPTVGHGPCGDPYAASPSRSRPRFGGGDEQESTPRPPACRRRQAPFGGWAVSRTCRVRSTLVVRRDPRLTDISRSQWHVRGTNSPVPVAISFPFGPRDALRGGGEFRDLRSATCPPTTTSRPSSGRTSSTPTTRATSDAFTATTTTGSAVTSRCTTRDLHSGGRGHGDPEVPRPPAHQRHTRRSERRTSSGANATAWTRFSRRCDPLPASVGRTGRVSG